MIIFNDKFELTNIDGSTRVANELSKSEFNNQLEYSFSDDEVHERWFWSLPTRFLGNQLFSYGGNLSYNVQSSGYGDSHSNQRIIIIGSGITLTYIGEVYHTDGYNTVALNENDWSDERESAGYPISRDKLIKVLSDITAIRISASDYEETYNSQISDIILDTAVDHSTGEQEVTHIEKCRCPVGFAGSSCEKCDTLYYRDVYQRTGVSSCKQCSCNSRNTDSCDLDSYARVVCHCKHGYTGESCDYPSGNGK